MRARLCAASLLVAFWVSLGSCKPSAPLEAPLSSKPDRTAEEAAYIPAGQYIIGCDAALPCFTRNAKRRVSVTAFWIDKFKALDREYLECVRARACPEPHYEAVDADWETAAVDIDSANAYCRWRGGRLPSGDQWEIAARGSDQRLYPWGNQFDKRRLPKARIKRLTHDLDMEYFVRHSDPAASSPFGVSELSGGGHEFALGSRGVELRGAPQSDVDAEPLDYSAVVIRVAVPMVMASFRCVYDHQPH